MPESVKYNPLKTAKDRFLENPANITNHRALVDSAAFQRACDTATIEYGRRLADESSRNPNLSGANGMKQAGMTEFLLIFIALSEKMTAPPPVRVMDALPDETQARRQ
jgi:hypothetical protein